MRLGGIADPIQLKMLTCILDDFCQSHEIAKDSTERQEAASFLLTLFHSGVDTADELKAVLQQRPQYQRPSI